jgi:hypothetical protein
MNFQNVKYKWIIASFRAGEFSNQSKNCRRNSGEAMEEEKFHAEGNSNYGISERTTKINQLEEVTAEEEMESFGRRKQSFEKNERAAKKASIN